MSMVPRAIFMETPPPLCGSKIFVSYFPQRHDMVFRQGEENLGWKRPFEHAILEA
jgi:hypothetical protein